MFLNVCPDNVFRTTEHFVPKPGTVVKHHKPECPAEKLVHCVQCQCNSEGLYNQNMTISVASACRFATKLGLVVQHHKLESL